MWPSSGSRYSAYHPDQLRTLNFILLLTTMFGLQKQKLCEYRITNQMNLLIDLTQPTSIINVPPCFQTSPISFGLFFTSLCNSLGSKTDILWDFLDNLLPFHSIHSRFLYHRYPLLSVQDIFVDFFLPISTVNRCLNFLCDVSILLVCCVIDLLPSPTPSTSQG